MTRFQHQGRIHVLGLHPSIQVLECVVGLLDVVCDVHQISVNDVASQVLPQRSAQIVVVFDEQGPERIELRFAPRYRASSAGQEKLSLPGDERGVIGVGHCILHCVVGDPRLRADQLRRSG